MKLLLLFSLCSLLATCAGYDTTVGLGYTDPNGASYTGTINLHRISDK